MFPIKRINYLLSFLIVIFILFFIFFNFTYKKQQQSTSLFHSSQLSKEKIPVSILQKSKPKEKIKIAILDSGIDKKHEDLNNQVKDEVNMIHPNVPIIDELGHGTAVAGIIAAKDNSIGFSGVSPHVELYSVKVLDKDGNGSVEDIIKGIEWSIDKGVDIINLSFGISKDKPLLNDAINKAFNENIIFVASAGNTYGGKAEYPAAYDKVISVTAVDKNKDIPSFTSKGKIDFSAPGVDIAILAPNNQYTINSGTSLATPFVTGTVALILQNKDFFNIDPNEDLHEQVYKVLQSFSEDLGENGKDEMYGEGVLSLPLPKSKGVNSYENK